MNIVYNKCLLYVIIYPERVCVYYKEVKDFYVLLNFETFYLLSHANMYYQLIEHYQSEYGSVIIRVRGKRPVVVGPTFQNLT